MYQVSTIIFSEQTKAQVLETEDWQIVAAELEAIDLPLERPTLVLIGGASHLSDKLFQQMQRLFTEVLAPVAEKLQAVVVDGGTNAGIMRLMGQARSQIGGTFPLVGVLPRNLAIWPGELAQTEQQAPLEPNHTHFVLVPGNAWGDESATLAQIATVLSKSAASVAVMLNGGTVTWKDARQNLGEGRLLLVVNGSGRAADQLAAVAKGDLKGAGTDAVNDTKATVIVQTELIEVIELDSASDIIARRIESILNSGK